MLPIHEEHKGTETWRPARRKKSIRPVGSQTDRSFFVSLTSARCGSFRLGRCVGLAFVFTRARYGFATIGDVPTRTFEDNADGMKNFVHASRTLGALTNWRVLHRLEAFKVMTAVFTYVFVDRHS